MSENNLNNTEKAYKWIEWYRYTPRPTTRGDTKTIPAEGEGLPDYTKTSNFKVFRDELNGAIYNFTKYRDQANPSQGELIDRLGQSYKQLGTLVSAISNAEYNPKESKITNLTSEEIWALTTQFDFNRFATDCHDFATKVVGAQKTPMDKQLAINFGEELKPELFQKAQCQSPEVNKTSALVKLKDFFESFKLEPGYRILELIANNEELATKFPIAGKLVNTVNQILGTPDDQELQLSTQQLTLLNIGLARLKNLGQEDTFRVNDSDKLVDGLASITKIIGGLDNKLAKAVPLLQELSKWGGIEQHGTNNLATLESALGR